MEHQSLAVAQHPFGERASEPRGIADAAPLYGGAREVCGHELARFVVDKVDREAVERHKGYRIFSEQRVHLLDIERRRDDAPDLCDGGVLRGQPVSFGGCGYVLGVQLRVGDGRSDLRGDLADQVQVVFYVGVLIQRAQVKHANHFVLEYDGRGDDRFQPGPHHPRVLLRQFGYVALKDHGVPLLYRLL